MFWEKDEKKNDSSPAQKPKENPQRSPIDLGSSQYSQHPSNSQFNQNYDKKGAADPKQQTQKPQNPTPAPSAPQNSQNNPKPPSTEESSKLMQFVNKFADKEGGKLVKDVVLDKRGRLSFKFGDYSYFDVTLPFAMALEELTQQDIFSGYAVDSILEALKFVMNPQGMEVYKSMPESFTTSKFLAEFVITNNNIQEKSKEKEAWAILEAQIDIMNGLAGYMEKKRFNKKNTQFLLETVRKIFDNDLYPAQLKRKLVNFMCFCYRKGLVVIKEDMVAYMIKQKLKYDCEPVDPADEKSLESFGRFIIDTCSEFVYDDQEEDLMTPNNLSETISTVREELKKKNVPNDYCQDVFSTIIKLYEKIVQKNIEFFMQKPAVQNFIAELYFDESMPSDNDLKDWLNHTSLWINRNCKVEEYRRKFNRRIETMEEFFNPISFIRIWMSTTNDVNERFLLAILTDKVEFDNAIIDKFRLNFPSLFKYNPQNDVQTTFFQVLLLEVAYKLITDEKIGRLESRALLLEDLQNIIEANKAIFKQDNGNKLKAAFIKLYLRLFLHKEAAQKLVNKYMTKFSGKEVPIISYQIITALLGELDKQGNMQSEKLMELDKFVKNIVVGCGYDKVTEGEIVSLPVLERAQAYLGRAPFGDTANILEYVIEFCIDHRKLAEIESILPQTIITQLEAARNLANKAYNNKSGSPHVNLIVAQLWPTIIALRSNDQTQLENIKFPNIEPIIKKLVDTMQHCEDLLDSLFAFRNLVQLVLKVARKKNSVDARLVSYLCSRQMLLALLAYCDLNQLEDECRKCKDPEGQLKRVNVQLLKSVGRLAMTLKTDSMGLTLSQVSEFVAVWSTLYKNTDNWKGLPSFIKEYLISIAKVLCPNLETPQGIMEEGSDSSHNKSSSRDNQANMNMTNSMFGSSNSISIKEVGDKSLQIENTSNQFSKGNINQSQSQKESKIEPSSEVKNPKQNDPENKSKMPSIQEQSTEEKEEGDRGATKGNTKPARSPLSLKPASKK